MFGTRKNTAIALLFLKPFFFKLLILNCIGAIALSVPFRGIDFLNSSKAIAQIAPDNTLNSPSIVNSNNNTVVITGGTRAGENLFHSFQEFSIPTGTTASFRQVNSDITNIISRITGGNISNIDGTIEALQNNGNLSSANFFIINPNGIVFGQNASLNVGGSFFATTADSIKFNDGTEFSAVNPQSSPLLTVSTPIGLQFGKTPGEIRNESLAPLIDTVTGDPIIDEFSGEPFFGGLQVVPDKTLALVGGPVQFSGGVITVEGGRVEIGSVGDGGLVKLDSTENGWKLDYQGINKFQDIQFSDFSQISLSSSGDGKIQIQGEKVSLIGESVIGNANNGEQSDGEIEIRASRLEVDDFSLIFSNSLNSGKAADIIVQANQLVTKNGGQIISINFADGNTGNIDINAKESIEADGGVIFDDVWFPSGLLTQVGETATGNGGELNITTNQLQVSNGAQITSGTFGAGNSGSINVRASEVEISGSALTEDGTQFRGVQDLPVSSGLYSSTEPGSTGDGGELSLNADKVILSNGGVLQSATFGSGDAGNLKVKASELIEVNGTDAENIFPTSIFAASGGITGVRSGVPEATGKGGNVDIETPLLRVIDGANIAVGSINPNVNEAEGAGNLTIKADNIYLDGGRLVSDTASGSGGDINLQLQDLLILRNNSRISSSAGSSNQPGDGGNIDIQSPNGFIVAVPDENSDITANAFSGFGGDVTINAAGIFGIQPLTRDDLIDSLRTDDPTQLNPANLQTSDITAVSRQQPNSSGSIEIDTLDNEIQTQPQLPTELRQTQFDQRCQNAGGEVAKNSFTIPGRGGLPPSPDQALIPSTPWEDWRIVENNNPLVTNQARIGNIKRQSDTVNTKHNNNQKSQTSTPKQIVEATGWIVDPQGNIVLTANASHTKSGNTWKKSPVCNVVRTIR
ncbi:MAG: filamentous hemagglutinin N-terminal domain-containing protein [Mastigocoleus sp.]